MATTRREPTKTAGTARARARTFHMKFEPMTIEHLGLRLYSTLPPVLSELVSNAYDAESPKVEILLPPGAITAQSEVVVRDLGHGMSADDLEGEYLPIGRNRRGPDARQVKSKNGKRQVTGRKGLGKLSSFGIADEMEIRAVKQGQAWALRLNYEEMKSWAQAHPGMPYEPTIVNARTGPTRDVDGVEIRLRRLHRTRSIDPDVVRHGLAQRLEFIGTAFAVFVNGEPIAPGDRTRKKDCDSGLWWDVADTPSGSRVENGQEVRGWIGFVGRSSQTGRGIDIFAKGKAAELGSFFNDPSTHAQLARAYLVGEINADFLDGDDDLIATARNSVIWESAQAQALQTWGQGLLRWAAGQWLERRRKKKEEEITHEAEFDTWLAKRQPSEQRAAKRMLKILVDDENLDPGSARPLLEIIKASVETVAFHELVEALEVAPAGGATLLRLFGEWRVIEAREHLRLADGRLAAIEKLEEFINEGALEVQQMQPLMVQNPWMLNSAWTEVDVQPTYTKMLRDNCKEPKAVSDEDRRLDIVGITEGSLRMTVVEIKRPQKTLNREDLDQIETYVDWARANILGGTGPDSPQAVEGLLVMGKINRDRAIQEKVERLRKDGIRVETYRDLHNAARQWSREIEQRLENVAPEYTRKSRKARAKGKA